ncbi:FAD-binding protein [Streptomyces antibioticus]|uniref:FAD-binding protein n=1 Tax=Streptomyces antibioticus TaxID=1890 RepID=UPI0036757AB4
MSSVGHQLATSVLVVGTGASGLRAAIEVAEAGVSVIAAGKSAAGGAHSAITSGAVKTASVPGSPSTTWEQRAARMLLKSHSLADTHAVLNVARNCPKAFHDMENYPSFLLHRGHFESGMHRALRERADQLAIPMLSRLYVTRLLVDDGVIFGAYGFDLVDGSRYTVHADAVILAMGGHTRLWQRTSSRRGENTGDSFRLAVDAGARLRDAEMVQFCPYGLVEPENAAGTLVSDAVGDAGGILLNNLGERFMRRYDPERMELTHPEKVALASHAEIKEGRGTRGGGVWLDLSHLPRETVLTRLSGLHQALIDLQMVDITRDPVEVAPTAHYSLGGVWVRPEDHSTDVSGLFATGETASGLHGGYGLEGDLPLGLLVYGQIVGQAAVDYSAGLTGRQRSKGAVRAAEADVNRLLSADGDQNVRAMQRSVRRLMTERAGVLRHEAGIIAGVAELDEIESRMEGIGVHVDISGFQDLAYVFNLRSAVLSARATLESALERRETRGCHIRSDYPHVDPELKVNMVWSPTTGVSREPVAPIPTDIAKLMSGMSADNMPTE